MRGFRFALMVCGVCGVLAACSGDGAKDVLPPDEPVDVLYNRASSLLDKGERHEAAKAFSEVERQHPYSLWATRAQLMEAYADYLEMDYDEAVKVLSDFIELHPGHPTVAYAYYLRALCHYERIADVRRDQGFARDALKAMQDIISRFPDTVYARDAVLKIALINDHLAGAEMEVGRWYLKQKIYIAAIGRFRAVVDRYQTTSHVPEALERLVEAYLSLGIDEEAKRDAAVLGHNFPGSDWYQDAYRLLVKRGVVTEGVADARSAGEKKAQAREASAVLAAPADSAVSSAPSAPATLAEKPVEEAMPGGAAPFAKAAESGTGKDKERALPPDFSMMKDDGSDKTTEFLRGGSAGTGTVTPSEPPKQTEPKASASPAIPADTPAETKDSKSGPEIRIEGNEAKPVPAVREGGAGDAQSDKP